jgi:hypothetical protein
VEGEVSEVWLSRPRDAFLAVILAFFDAIADWDCRRLVPTAGDSVADEPATVTQADIDARMANEKDIPVSAPGDVSRYLDAIRDDSQRATLFEFIRLIQTGRTTDDKKGSPEAGNPVLHFLPQFFLFLGRWLDIYDATIKGESIDSFLENVQERNSAMHAETSRGSSSRLRSAWDAVTKDAPVGPAEPLSQSKFNTLDDIGNVSSLLEISCSLSLTNMSFFRGRHRGHFEPSDRRWGFLPRANCLSVKMCAN